MHTRAASTRPGTSPSRPIPAARAVALPDDERLRLGSRMVVGALLGILAIGAVAVGAILLAPAGEPPVTAQPRGEEAVPTETPRVVPMAPPTASLVPPPSPASVSPRAGRAVPPDAVAGPSSTSPGVDSPVDAWRAASAGLPPGRQPPPRRPAR
jgi:hypothetical protein